MRWRVATLEVAALAAALLSPAAAARLPMDRFARPPHAGRPSNVFHGRLTLDSLGLSGSFHVLKDQYGEAKEFGGAARRLPAFDFEFVQSHGALIPIRRGAIPDTHPLWEFIIEPGKVWDEKDGGGFSRASLPFALEERNQNCMHNGVLTFLFRDDGVVSDASYEIASETCAYFQFDMSGLAGAHYVPGKVADGKRAISDYREEAASRLPTEPIKALALKYPDIDISQFGSQVKPADMTLYGVVADGVNYVGGCATRAGRYPFCGEMDLPSYSLAKSVFAGLMSMRLSLLYPGAIDEKIAPFVPQCAPSGNWGDVTFLNALDMATGNYDSGLDQADENSPDMQTFFGALTHADKIDFACNHYPRQSAPGTLWVYHTTDTYALGSALRAYYQAKAGADRDFTADLLVDPLWHGLRLHPAVDVPRRTYDDVAQPFAGYGLTLTSDDIAKLALFLDGGGTIDGTQVVDAQMLAGALQRDPADPGLRAASDAYRYNHGFWAWNAQAALGCRSPAWIPFMSGFGGIIVALFPNGVTYYYVSDGGAFAFSNAAAEADKIKPFCEK